MTSDVCVNLCIGMRSLPLHQSAEVSITPHPTHLSTCWLIAAISSTPNKLTPITAAYQRRFSVEQADEVEGEVVRGWETGEVRKWGDGRRGREIPRWVLLSSLRITATCTSASVAEGSVPQVHISASPNEYPTVERKQMWWVWFSHKGLATDWGTAEKTQKY